MPVYQCMNCGESCNIKTSDAFPKNSIACTHDWRRAEPFPAHNDLVGPTGTRSDRALGFIPVIMMDLDNDSREMLIQVLSATSEAAYDEGFRDAKARFSKN